MGKTATRQKHFREFAGSSATRAISQGECEFADPQLQPPVIQQLEALVNGAGTDEEFNRMGGHLRKLLAEAQRSDFETVFVHVANARLPKNTFLAIVEEARRIWRGEYASIVPPSHRAMKKIRSLRQKQAAEASDPDA